MKTHQSRFGRSRNSHPEFFFSFLTIFLAGFAGPPALSQLPPGGRVVQIEMPGRQLSPSINDARQVAFGGVTGPTTREIYLYDGGEVVQLTSGAEVNGSPEINNHGHITWIRGEFDRNQEVYLDDGVAVFQITETPQPEQSPAINDSGQLAWSLPTCGDGQACSEVFFLASLDAEPLQLTNSRGVHLNDIPRLSEAGTVAWWQTDHQWGLFNTPDRILLFDGKRITSLTSDENAYNAPAVSPNGRIAWNRQAANPLGPVFEWIDGAPQQVLPYGGVTAINDRGDLFFNTLDNLGMSWIHRNGVFYQPFAGRTSITVQDANAGGDCVGKGSGFDEAPADIFLSLIDPIAGDHDEDGDLDLADAAGLNGCLGGPEGGLLDETCGRVDFDGDADVDLRDFAAFQVAFTGDCALGITTPPGGQGVCIGDEVRMSVDVRGRVASYQWTYERIEIPEATEQTYVIPSAGRSDDAEYGVIVTSECGWESRSDKRHRLKVHTSVPVFDQQPVSQQACRGQDIRFCAPLRFVEDDAFHFVDFKWQKDGVDIEGVSDWFCLVLRDVDEGDVGSYRCVATNACGTTISSSATLTLAPDDSPPRLLTQPEDIAVDQGQPASFIVIAACADSFQWKRDGEDLPGETRADLFIFPVTCAHEGDYTVTAINTHGEVTSNPATLTVNGCP